METDNNYSAIKIITPTAHSVIDYAALVLFVIAPSAFGLSGVFAYGAYGLAAAYFLLTITTRFDGGLFAVLSFRTHGLIELLIALGVVVSPWIFQFADQATERNFFLLMGIALFVSWLLTNYNSPNKQEDTSDKQKSKPETQTKQADIDEQSKTEGETIENNEDQQ